MSVESHPNPHEMVHHQTQSQCGCCEDLLRQLEEVDARGVEGLQLHVFDRGPKLYLGRGAQ